MKPNHTQYPQDYRRPQDVDRYNIDRLVPPPREQEPRRPHNDYYYNKPAVVDPVYIDRNRRPEDGRARSRVTEVNIEVIIGPSGRSSQKISVSNDGGAERRPVRSTAVIDDARYVDFTLQSPQSGAQISTDGIIRNPSSLQQSGGFERQIIH